MPDRLTEWIDVDGVAWPLMGDTADLTLLEGQQGRHMPPVRVVEQRVPGLPGAQVRAVEHDVREVALPVLFVGVTDGQLRARIRKWEQRLDPARGNGRLRVTDSNGNVRELTCRYVGGLQLEDRRDTWQRAVLTFRAQDPYWRGPETGRVWQLNEPVSFFPILPVRLSSSQVFATSAITVAGDVATQPVWTIKGPGSNITIENVGTGREVAWSGTLLAGEQLTIDTRDARQTTVPRSVRDATGTNRFAELTAWDLWPLEPGAQTIRLWISGATTDTEVSCRWQPAYLGA